MIQEVADLRTIVPAALELEASSETIHVYVFRRRATFHEYVGRYFPSVPRRRALFIKQRGPGMVFAYASDELPVDLRHEATHAILHTLLPMVPLWLDEGLAEYFEAPPSRQLTGHPHLTEVRRHVRWKRVPDLEVLEQIQDINQMSEKRYRDSWAWVHFLRHGPAIARRELTWYLKEIKSQTLPARLSARLPRVLPDWRAEFCRHFNELA